MNKPKLKIAEIEKYIKESMCIDGSVKFLEFQSMEYLCNYHKGMVFEIEDTKRGKFYIGWYK